MNSVPHLAKSGFRSLSFSTYYYGLLVCISISRGYWNLCYSGALKLWGGMVWLKFQGGVELLRNIGQRDAQRAHRDSKLVLYHNTTAVGSIFQINMMRRWGWRCNCFMLCRSFLQIVLLLKMGKLNVSMLRYLSSEEFRVLTAVRKDNFPRLS